MHPISFSITNWKIVNCYFHTDEDWLLWAKEKKNIHDFEYQIPNIKFLPILQKRRLNLSAKLMIQASWNLINNDEKIPLIFSSHNGEINRSFDLYVKLLKENIISPTSFGLSVHNAVPGQWSLLRKDMSEYTAISSTNSNLELAVLEAVCILKEGFDSVLIVLTEEKNSIGTQEKNLNYAFSYSLALNITLGKEWTLTKKDKLKNHNLKNYDYWSPILWVKNMQLLNKKKWTNNIENISWIWKKNI